MWITRCWFESSAKRFIYFVLHIIFPLNFVKILLAYEQRYSLKISTATRVIDHAESENAIFILRESTLQNPSTVTYFFIVFYIVDYVHGYV